MTELQSKIPSVRVRHVGGKTVNANGEYILYWMIANRRAKWNFSLQRAVEWAQHLRKPLVIFEALRAGYEWASDRIHTFVIQGMIENQQAFANRPVTYFPYLERQHGDGRGLLAELSKRACLVVSDDFPCFFLPRMIESATSQVPTRFELVDSNGLFPMRSTDRVFARAYDFRRFLQKNLLPHLGDFPQKDPLARKTLPVLRALPKKSKSVGLRQI